MRRLILPSFIVPVALLLGACVNAPSTPDIPAADVSTSTPPVLENTPSRSSETNPLEIFSSDRFGLCFSYPQGYSSDPDSDTVYIIAPDLPDTDTKGRFWLETNDANDRTAGMIADQEMSSLTGMDMGRWTVTLDGEEAVVLDGMPGQDLQRRVYVVHQQTLYVLAFMPTRSENKAANLQMETLYAEIASSWSWSPCSDNE
jgi:hypothetical protein